MQIKLETSKRTGIRNIQETDVSDFSRTIYEKLDKRFSLATPRTEFSALYNCHGLTFASRRTRVEDTSEVHKILNDDKWQQITEMRDVLPGDIVVYFSVEGEANHSGIVVGYDENLLLPMICSKWNLGREYVHPLTYCPDIYGPDRKFYRCRL